MRRMTMSVLCAAAAACGGRGGNAAAAKQPNYGPPTAASTAQVVAIEGTLSSILAFQRSPNYESAMAAAMVMNTSNALLGSPNGSPSGTSSSAEQKALVQAKSAALLSPNDVDPGCVAVTSTSVTLTNCTIPVSDSAEGVTGSATINGAVTLNSYQSLTWDLRISVEIDVSTRDGSGSGGGSLHTAGTLVVIPPSGSADASIFGNETAELSLGATSGGKSLSMGVNDLLDLNLTYQASADPCITGGTLEAKRSDSSVPNDFSRPSDKAELVTFTGCNTATAQSSN